MLARFGLIESIWFGKYGISVSLEPVHSRTKLTKPDVGIAAQPLFNGALDEDKLDDGCVRAIKAMVLFVLLIGSRFSPSTGNLTISRRNHLVNALPFIRARLHCDI